ncbi:ImmA/IrrE family metallo-endopeptidase [Streptomyces sp. ISID311]|nr:ImmA/IrrE family metallo-endopeptidase [Streptomyces sp. ISID311]
MHYVRDVYFHRCPSEERGGTMTTRQVRKRCQALVSALDLPRPFSVEALIHELSVRRGRPIQIHTVSLGSSLNACGLWIATKASDDIYVEEKTTKFHQEHIILHEIGHILCDHSITDQENQGALSALLPSISPELISRLLARTNYTTEQEQEAELVASLIHAAAGMLTPSPSTGVRGALEAALGIRE